MTRSGGSAVLVLALIALGAPAAMAQDAREGFEPVLWRAVASGHDPVLYQAYLNQYPDGAHAAQARGWLAARSHPEAARTARAASQVADAVRAAAAQATPPKPLTASLFANASAPVPPMHPAPDALATPELTLPEQTLAEAEVPAAPVMAAPLPPAAPVAATLSGPLAERLAALRAAGEAQITPVVATPPLRVAVAPTPVVPPLPAPRRSRVRPAVLIEYSGPVASTAAISPAMQDLTTGFLPTVTPIGMMLGQVVNGQMTPGFSPAAMADETMSLPLRPAMAAVPEVVIPGAFCSLEQRNAFHEGVYLPALAVAQHNNEAAVAYIHRLQGLYDSYQLSGDVRVLRAIAAEAREFQPMAAAAYSLQDKLVHQFAQLMGAPVQPCGELQ